MKILSICAMAAMTACGTVIPQSGEKVLIGDAEYVLIGTSDWDSITNSIAHLKSVAADRLRREMETENGRVFWHGAKKSSYVTNDCFVIEYADGYKHEQKTAKQRRVISERFHRPRIKAATPHGREEILARRAAALSRTNEVSVTIER